MDNKPNNHLQNTLGKFELALGQIQESIIFTSIEGNIQWCNEVFYKTTGCTTQQAVNAHLSEIFHLSSKTDVPLPWEWFSVHPDKKLLKEYVHGNNSHKKTYLIYGKPVKTSDDDVSYVFVISDITERKKREKISIQSQKLESIGTLAAGIAHELNTPIQYINDNVLFLKDSINDLTQFVELMYKLVQSENNIEDLREKIHALYKDIDVEYLQSEVPISINETQKGTTHIAKLVRSMKQFSHPGSQELIPVSIKAVVETVMDVTKNTWKNDASIELSLDEKLDTVYSIHSELNQVLMNLIVNARDAIVEKFGENSKQGIIKIANSLSGNFVEITVSDNGTGIPDDLIGKVFDPFFTTKEVGKGTGQGLSMIYHIVTTTLQGDVDLQTEVGTGTTFIISLPQTLKERAHGKA